MRNTRTYSDIDLNFGVHPTSKDINKKYDEEAVKASIRNLLMTANYERPFHSDIGSNLKALMFEPITPMLYGIIKTQVTNMVSNYEKRATVLDVVTTYYPDSNEISIDVIFKINGSALVAKTNITLERTR